jgi:hypothetical protein
MVFACKHIFVYHIQILNTYPANELIVFQYISNKMQRYTVYLYLETALHVSGGVFNPSSEAHTPVSTVSDICHTVTAICRYQLEPG